MLFFLGFAAQRGFLVTAYDDRAVGVISKTEDGREWMTGITLNPHVVFAGAKRPSGVEVDVLHHDAHAACYIANSVKAAIIVSGRAEGLR
jgi:organic hydroperoxide reductase OsmC/OhrA